MKTTVKAMIKITTSMQRCGDENDYDSKGGAIQSGVVIIALTGSGVKVTSS